MFNLISKSEAEPHLLPWKEAVVILFDDKPPEDRMTFSQQMCTADLATFFETLGTQSGKMPALI